MSLTRTRAVLVLGAALACGVARAEEPLTFAVVVGANLGGADDEPLRYAESDARRMRTLLVELGGVRAEHALVITGGGADDVRRAIDQVRALVEQGRNAGRATAFVFYYSGHGDEDALHLPRGPMPLADLRAAISAIPAPLRVSVIDACRGTGREKGVHLGPAISTATTPDPPHGTIEVRASALGESAQESEELAGSIFTHYLVSALRGAADVDGDGRVTLSEAYAYAYRRTLLRTGAQGPALQHPTLSVTLSGGGEVVLTRTSQAAAVLEVRDAAERYLVFQWPSAAVMGELTDAGARSLALPAGRYIVVRRTRDGNGVAQINLSGGGRRVLRAQEFRAVSREQLVARGGHIELRPFLVQLRIGSELAPLAIEGPAFSGQLALDWSRGPFVLEGALGYSGGPLSTSTFDGREDAITARLAVGLRVFLGRVTLGPSLGLAARYSFQRLAYHDADRAERAGVSFGPSRRAGGALGPALALRADIALAHHVVLAPMIAFDALVRREASSTGAPLAFHPLVSLSLGVGYVF